ncbi:helix-turn-helix domain-containing protein [Saccharomonospora azurea]|uniref:Transcription factor, MBF1 like protein n=1 Tax=Saccharomonospora azurea NA-128 TaxID=882081 RepID=H8G769_9PSEU|nr:putative transcription factor, MBF1 like protein [Saccharomonospora azurea NA-128]
MEYRGCAVPDRWTPALWDAASRGDYATVLRCAREQLGWSQGRLGQKFGCSASTISRFENGRRGLRDVTVLRRFATVLGLPAEAFGLTAAAQDRPGGTRTATRISRVCTSSGQEGDGQVRRRAFLLAAGLAGTAMAAPGAVAAPRTDSPIDPAAFLASRLEAVLLGPTAVEREPASPAVLRSALHAAREDFHGCRYVELGVRLPELLTAAESAHGQHASAETARLAAHAYNLATRALLKLDASGLEWVSADRGLRMASGCDDALVLAEATRLLGSVCRRAGHHERAQDLTLSAAEQLDLTGREPDPRHLALHGVLLCSAGYAAARGGDHDRATELLDEAEATTARLSTHPAQQTALAANVLSHRVSAHYVLGDAGTALHHSQGATLAQFPDTERRARFLVDVALCLAQWDKPDRAFQTLLAAERAAPGEVRTRATVRRLVSELLHHPRQASLPGLRQLAARTHALT